MWEVAEYIGESLVFIGVIGEVYAEWKDPHRERLGRLSSIVLVIGLAISLAALVGTNEFFNGTIASLNLQAKQAGERAAEDELDAAQARKEAESFQSQIADDNARVKEAEAQVASANTASRDAVAKVATADARIAEAQKGAAQATATAEQEKLEESQLELLISPRRLTLEQQGKIGAACTRMNRVPVQVGSYGMDTEGKPLAKQIASAIFDHTFNVNFDPGGPVTSGALDEGVLISGPVSAERYMDCLAGALENIGQLEDVRISGERHVGGATIGGNAIMSGNATMGGGTTTVSAGPKPEGSPIEIFVGIKPIDVELKP